MMFYSLIYAIQIQRRIVIVITLASSLEGPDFEILVTSIHTLYRFSRDEILSKKPRLHSHHSPVIHHYVCRTYMVIYVLYIAYFWH
jgi:hypothetical protein